MKRSANGMLVSYDLGHSRSLCLMYGRHLAPENSVLVLGGGVLGGKYPLPFSENPALHQEAKSQN